METVWLQFPPRFCRAQTRKAMPAAHRMTPSLSIAGFVEATLRELNIGRRGSKNAAKKAAIMASMRPTLCSRCPWVSCFTPIAETVKYAMTMSQIAYMSQMKIEVWYVFSSLVN